MTLIIDMGDWWIEYHHVARSTVVPLAFQNVVITLDRPGHFMGGSVVADADNGVVQGNNLTNGIGATELFVGTSIVSVRASGQNVAPGDVELGLHVLVFMRT